MDSFQRGHVHETSRVAQYDDAFARAPPRKRVEATLGDRLGSPFDQLPTLEQRSEQRMLFELLQQDVDIEAGVAVIESDHEAERHEIRLEGVDEAPTERVGGQRPSERMDHAIERSFCLPQLFHTEREDLAWSMQQFRPYVLMMNTRAKASIFLAQGKFPEAIIEIEEGRDTIAEFFQRSNFPELASKSSEIAFLEEWLDEVRAKRPLSKLEVMEREMETAIAKELYERAAELRDAIRQLKAQETLHTHAH